MNKKIESTFIGQLFIGLKEGYTGPVHTIEEVEQFCRTFCTNLGWCVTVTPTHFCYKNGDEPGVIIGAINYPRFPQVEGEIVGRLEELADQLMFLLKQERCTVVFPKSTIMLERE